MSNACKNDLLLYLANTLGNSHMETAAITAAIEQICKTSAWHCGLIYEKNRLSDYCLSENYASCSAAYPACLNADAFTAQECALLAQTTMLYIAQNADHTPLENKLLLLYNAESLVVAPMIDEQTHLYGLLVLLRLDSAADSAEPDLDMLSIALCMLMRYLSMRMYQRKLNQAQVTMESILDNTGIDIYVNDFETHDILYVNKSMAAPYGGQVQFSGHKCWQVLFPQQSGPCEFCPQNKLIDENGMPSKIYTWDYQRAFDGSWFRVFSAAFRWVDGRLAHVVSSADITDNKRNEALVENLANYDQLTRLPNRRMLVAECDRLIDNATEGDHGFVLFFDIDGFKNINDQLGHDAGDEFLVQLGEFFSSIPLLKNAIYRNGGDEFVALIDGESITRNSIQSLAYFIHNRFQKPWVLKKGPVLCNTSIGVSCYPEDGETSELLLQKADMAMYQVKKSGGGSMRFSSQAPDPV